jgi:hypothetical protein
MKAAALSIKEGITQGTDNQQLSPKANARAQASSFLSCKLKKLHFINLLLFPSVFLHIK